VSFLIIPKEETETLSDYKHRKSAICTAFSQTLVDN